MSLSQIRYPEIDRTGTMVDSNESRFNQSRTLRLFPTFVWKTDLGHEIFQVINEGITGALRRVPIEMWVSRPDTRMW